ncbi:hypothetical protein [Nocardioides pantholopis]|uniref:hypothetical protein n=1 Tax=Nocardioides pantholopis TaxID=2483798 RepID=UPI000FDBB9C5|nr:hypothetical protein [Nocardioides pantholopis]
MVLRGPWPAAASGEPAAEPTQVRVRGARSGDLDRQAHLVARWLGLSRSLAATGAHGDRDGLLSREDELLAALDAIEMLIAEQVADAGALLDGLAGWAAGLLHVDAGGDRTACLSCRRAASASGGHADDLAWARELVLEHGGPGPEPSGR